MDQEKVFDFNFSDEKMIYKESTYKLDDFTQEITNKNGKKVKVFDFHKFDKTPFFITFLFTERGLKGKTYNSKQFIIDEWKTKKKRALWVRNQVQDIVREAQNYMSKDCPPDLGEMLQLKGAAEKNTLGCYDMNFEGPDKKVIGFQSIMTAENEKGTRTIYDNIFLDEFNVNYSRIGERYITNFDSLMHSTENIIQNYGGEDSTKIYIFGNSKSLNHPLPISMGLTVIKWEVSELWYNGLPMVLVVCPIMNEEQRSQFYEDNKRNKRFMLSEMFGTAGHAYFNDFLFDKVNYVEPVFRRIEQLKKAQQSGLKPSDFYYFSYCIFHNSRYYAMFRKKDLIPFKTELDCIWHVAEIREDKVPIVDGKKDFYILNSNDIVEEGMSLQGQDAKYNFRKLLERGLVSFEDLPVRELFISSIRR